MGWCRSGCSLLWSAELWAFLRVEVPHLQQPLVPFDDPHSKTYPDVTGIFHMTTCLSIASPLITVHVQEDSTPERWIFLSNFTIAFQLIFMKYHHSCCWLVCFCNGELIPSIQCITPAICTFSWKLSNPTDIITLHNSWILIPFLFSILMYLCCNTWNWTLVILFSHDECENHIFTLFLYLFSLSTFLYLVSLEALLLGNLLSGMISPHFVKWTIVQPSPFLREDSLHIKAKDLGAIQV